MGLQHWPSASAWVDVRPGKRALSRPLRLYDDGADDADVGGVRDPYQARRLHQPITAFNIREVSAYDEVFAGLRQHKLSVLDRAAADSEAGMLRQFGVAGYDGVSVLICDCAH
jgi:hypothetical protein